MNNTRTPTTAGKRSAVKNGDRKANRAAIRADEASASIRRWLSRGEVVDKSQVLFHPEGSTSDVLIHRNQRLVVLFSIMVAALAIWIWLIAETADLLETFLTPELRESSLSFRHQQLISLVAFAAVWAVCTVALIRLARAANRKLVRPTRRWVYCPTDLIEDVYRTHHNVTLAQEADVSGEFAHKFQSIISEIGGVRISGTEIQSVDRARKRLDMLDRACLGLPSEPEGGRMSGQ
jgi:hypothetical protein